MTTVTYVHGGEVNTRLLSLFMIRSNESKVGLSDLLQLLFRRHVCLSTLKHTPTRALPLTAPKTVFSHNIEVTVLKSC